MYIDFKITTWDRVHIHTDDEEIVRKAIKEEGIETMQDFFNLKVDGTSWEKVDEVDEFMTPFENDNQPTLEVYESKGVRIYKNTESD